jgi:hypothetical protein
LLDLFRGGWRGVKTRKWVETQSDQILPIFLREVGSGMPIPYLLLCAPFAGGCVRCMGVSVARVPLAAVCWQFVCGGAREAGAYMGLYLRRPPGSLHVLHTSMGDGAALHPTPAIKHHGVHFWRSQHDEGCWMPKACCQVWGHLEQINSCSSWLLDLFRRGGR